MHPILTRIPLGKWSFPLGPTLLAVALLALAGAGCAWWLRRRAAAPWLAGLALASGAAALRFEHHVYSPADLVVPSFGLALACALSGGWFLTVRAATRRGLLANDVRWVIVAMLVGGVLGARLVYSLNANPATGGLALLALPRGGLSAVGAVLGGLAGGAVVGVARRQHLGQLLDAAALSWAGGVAVVRLGCFLRGCDFGSRWDSESPWARLGIFPRWENELGLGSPAFVAHLQAGWVQPSDGASLPVYPTQLYEAAVGVVAVAWVMWRTSRARFAGDTGLSTLALSLGLAAGLDSLRGDAERGALNGWLLLGAALGCAAVWIALRLGSFSGGSPGRKAQAHPLPR